MLIRVRAPTEVKDPSGDAMSFPERWGTSSRRLDDLSLAEYLDEELVDIGVVGGELWLRHESGAWYVDIDYWSPARLSPSQLDALLRDARAQLTDGAGESMTPAELENADLRLVADDRNACISMVDDGRVVSPPSELALHAKKGTLKTMLELLAREQSEELERKHGGLTPVQWSCLRGHAAVVAALLDAGASVSSGATSDPMSTPLATCVFSRDCNDVSACRIAEALVSRGASADFLLLAEQAETRGKLALARYLREQQQR